LPGHRPGRGGDGRVRRRDRGRAVRPTDGADRRDAGLDGLPRGGVRAGAGRGPVPDRGRGGQARQRHPVRAGRRGVDQGRAPGPPGGRADQGRHRLGQRLPGGRAERAVRRLRQLRDRPGERHARCGRVPGREGRLGRADRRHQGPVRPRLRLPHVMACLAEGQTLEPYSDADRVGSAVPAVDPGPERRECTVPFSTKDRIALVGAGAMGAPVVGHLVRAGFPVTVCDLNADRRAGAEAVGARSTSTVDDLGDCRVALVMVPTDDDVRLVAGRYGAVAPAGAVLVISSSVETATCLAIEEDLRLGGSDADVADLAAVFAPWSRRVNHLGPLGTGQVGKTVGNLIHWGEIVVLAEALSLGAELGVPVSVMRPVLEDGPADSRTLRELQEMRFTWYEKDIDIAVRMAATVDRELVLSTFVQRLMRDIDVPKMSALLADRGTIELTGALEALRH